MRAFILALIAMLSPVIVAAPAAALPIFAHQYGLSCQKCHTAMPALNEFGAAFRDEGYRLPGIKPGPAFPLAVKLNTVYSSAASEGLPKATVDEIELLVGGIVGSRGSYFAEQYLVDGGKRGLLRDAWYEHRLTPADAPLGASLRGGQFSLELPVDVEALRETVNHYAVYDQAIGRNPFTFFDPKLGVMLNVGAEGAAHAQFAVVQGHDRQSGLPTVGLDTMAALHHARGPLDLSVYRYAGRRVTRPEDGSPVIGAADRFTRTGVGLVYARGRLTSQSVLQQNTDSNADGLGLALRSSGGFSQLRYAFSERLFGIARYDGTSDQNGVVRTLTAALGMRTARNSRLTIEDVIAHGPTTTHTLNAQITVGY